MFVDYRRRQTGMLAIRPPWAPGYLRDNGRNVWAIPQASCSDEDMAPRKGGAPQSQALAINCATCVCVLHWKGSGGGTMQRMKCRRV